MKVVLLAPEFAASDGGIQRILRLYLSALAEDPAHTSVSLVALNDRPADLAGLALTAATTLRGKPLSVFGAAGSKLAFTRAAWAAGSGASRIVCGHVAQLPVAALALRPGARLAFVAHGIEVWPPLPAALRLALARVDRVFCVSRYTHDRLAANHSGLRKALRIVPNALDPALLEGPPPWVLPINQPPTILCVGRLCAADAYKGYDLLLRAFARMPRSELTHRAEPRLHFVGEGDDLPRLRALAAELKVAERVEFKGRLSDAALREAFAACSCFALPSTGEGFGLVYLEAMAAGRPCVGVRATAVPELITPEVGLLAPPEDPDALAGALADCLSRFWHPAKLREYALGFSYAHLVKALQGAWR
ncbi:MAG: glycosyltransferase family 4 protein [Opitutaceae bacterium]|jgi:glycosyltransferase involved in cell wall biosynthesis|nr:glycosyltransferase family 4 protein [Opitutaceae bacterium]